MPREKKDLLDEEVGASATGSVGKIVFILLLVVLFIGFVWYFMKYQEVKKQIVSLSSAQGQQELNQEEINMIIESVAKHIMLPEGETPTIATIEDADALAAQQSFFTNAKNGDKVLIYSDRAIIYSPERDTLVNVGPVYFQGEEGGVPAEGQEELTTPPAEEGATE